MLVMSLFVMSEQVHSQGVLLPPLQEKQGATDPILPQPRKEPVKEAAAPPAPAAVLPQPRKEPAAPPAPAGLDVLPPPMPMTKPLGKPPTLGEAVPPGTQIGRSEGSRPLMLQDILLSVDRHYPLVFAAEQERVIAEGKRLAAQGAFDVTLRSREFWDGTTYDNQRYSLLFEQKTPFHGLSYYGGWRLGSGEFPIYYFDRKTGTLGEFQGGMNLPLLRDRAIDQARATAAKASLDQALAEPVIHLRRLDIARAASLAYWIWVSTGQRYLIAQDILRVARDRDTAIAKRVRAGNLAEIERQDNLRVIIERQARLVVAQRAFEQASILLSLYHRDPSGNPVIPSPDQLPPFVEPYAPPDEERRQRDLEEAMNRRPEIQTLVLQRQKVQVDLDLALNQTLPGLGLGLAGAQKVGQTVKGVWNAYGEVALLFDVPLQRRNAQGRILTARAELAQLLAQERFARDRVQAEVQNALNALDRAYELLRRGRDNRLQNTYLEEAERRQFDVGKSDLFRVNIRELNTAEARVLEVDAAAEYYRALADYLAALGIDPSQTPK